MTLDDFLSGSMKGRSLFHFTDTRNIPSIKDAGGILSLAELKARKIVVQAPGGNDWSHQADRSKGMDEFVHPCFRANHPMEYTAKKDGRIKASKWISVKPEILKASGVRITLDVANKAGVGALEIEDALTQMDHEVLFRRMPSFNEDVRRRLSAAEKYEILVPKIVPLKLLSGL